jgi:uroporphyrin-III C-methyltransferase
MPHERLGRVLLVGAGPGAADLLTLRALRAIQSADVVLHDALIGADVLALIPAHVRRIEVGKRGHRLSTQQDFINRLMARLARGGAAVVRLKGGDPSLFGRAAEERAFLETRGIDVEVIPGVTAASAAAAQFGFSLTKRDVARNVLFATGRTAHGARLDWRAAADPETTLCVYMGCADLETITAELMASGRPADTPAVAAIDVERPHAQLIKCTLAELAAQARTAGASGPVLIVIGPACADARTAHGVPVSSGEAEGVSLGGGHSLTQIIE